MRGTRSPECASAWSRMCSAGRRNLGPRASSLLSGSFLSSCGVGFDCCWYVCDVTMSLTSSLMFQPLSWK